MAPSALRLPLLIATTVLAGLLAGCGSPARHERPLPGDAPAGPPPVAMTASASYLEGRLLAELSLTRGRLGEPKSGFRGDRPPREYAPMLRPHAIGETPPGVELGPRRPTSVMMNRPGGPALTLRLRLTNQGPDPIEVTILECSSALGDFAVRPERVQLAAGQSTEVDPMVSQLGVVAAKIDVLVRLQVAGKKESQTLTLQAVAPDELAAP